MDKGVRIMKGKKAEQLMAKIEHAFGLEKLDFRDGRPVYTKWGTPEDHIDIADLKHRSFKLAGDLGDVYIEKLHTDKWIVIGKGTTLHCDDIYAGEEIVKNFEGYLM